MVYCAKSSSSLLISLENAFNSLNIYLESKVVPYSMTSVGQCADPDFSSQPAGDNSHKPGGKLSLLFALPTEKQPYSLDCFVGAMGMYHCALENKTDFSFAQN